MGRETGLFTDALPPIAGNHAIPKKMVGRTLPIPVSDGFARLILHRDSRLADTSRPTAVRVPTHARYSAFRNVAYQPLGLAYQPVLRKYSIPAENRVLVAFRNVGS